MKLLTESDLIWSPVVANTRMNRERNASGINSYEQEFKFKPEAFLQKRIMQQGHATWLDICCGQGKALTQVASYLSANGLQEKAVLKGIDLIDTFSPIPPEISCLSFETGSIVDYEMPYSFDLITCVHGLHYIGDKLKVIEKVLQQLQPEGLFIANLDLNNIRINDEDATIYLKAIFRHHDIKYNVRTRILECKGTQNINFDLHYEGASDQAGPNYTGQEAVNSFYGK